MAWTIKGEAGKTLDDTVRSLESLRITTAELRFQSLASDTLMWTALTDDATGAGTIVPDVGQVVEIFLDGARKFRGHVTRPRVRTDSITVEVEGPWWWMTREPLTSTISSADGGSAERIKFVFPTGTLGGMVYNLIARAVAVGLPFTQGTNAAMFPMSKITLSGVNFADALAALLSRCADAGTRFDYSGASGTLPVLDIVRRGGADAMTPLTFTLGTDAIEGLDISPRLDLEVARTELHYVVRNPTTGLPGYATQADGVAATGKRQIVTISGPEIVDFLPLDDFASYAIQTGAASGAALASYVTSRDPETAATGVGWDIGNGATYTLLTNYSYTSGWTAGASVTQVTRPTSFLKKSGGAASLTGKTILLTEGLPEWVKRELGLTFEEIEITGDLVNGFLLNNNLGTSFPSPADTPLPAWYDSVTYYNGFSGGASVGSRQKWRFSFHRFSVSAVLVNASWGSLTALYRPWDYDYLSPPAGMAAGIRASQDWVPWEGQFTEVADEVTGANLLHRTIHLVGCLPACATMAAMLRGVSHDLMRGRTVYELGAPARLDFGTAVGRVAVSPQDVIIEL